MPGHDSAIEWTHIEGHRGTTLNLSTGCTKVSQGCKNCYAERLATTRFKDRYPEGFGKITLYPERLLVPAAWGTPHAVFVDSMSDFFHEDIPSDYIYDALEMMRGAPDHIFMLVTKRANRMNRVMDTYAHRDGMAPNIWTGVSVEDQETADERIPWLVSTPAAVRFISLEPMLAPVNLVPWLDPFRRYDGMTHRMIGQGMFNADQVGSMKSPVLDWVILGFESGPKARPGHPDHARQVRDDCVAAGVPFFFKQWGEWCPVAVARDPGWETTTETNRWMYERLLNPGGQYVGRPWGQKIKIHAFDDVTSVRRVGKRRAGRVLDGRTWDQFPAVVPAATVG